MRRSSAPLAYFAAGAASVAAASLLYSSAQSPKQKILPSPRSNEQKIAPPYAKADYIPGGRDISTPYGNLRVYESGPEDADRKVLLIHGISTPCVSVAGIGENLASKGCRVMLLDLFGHGWSDAPGDLKFGDRLYTTQILLAITSSSLHWSRFTLIGYSMGAGISANFTSYFPSMVEDLVLLAPAGLIRTSHLDWKTKATYSGWLPEWLVERLVKNRLRTSPNVKTTMRPQTALPTEQGSDPIAAETAAGRGKGGVKPMAFGRAVDAEAGIDQAAKAEAWGELVEKHGKRDWIEPLMDQCGPLAQLQLADLADYIEALANFCHWEVPNKTAASVFLFSFFSVCLLITLTADMAFCTKIFWFIIGTSFFFTYPLATRFPKYRRLLSAWRWFVWDIPTDSEWAIRTLQCKTLVRQAEMLDENQGGASWKHDTDSDAVSDYSTAEESAGKIPSRIHRERFRFRVYEGSTSGHLIIDRKSLRLTTSSSSWRIPVSNLIEMRKSSARKVVKAKALKASLDSIDFVYLDADGLEQTHVCSMPAHVRHEVFSLALGLSGLRWRVLQIERHKGTSHLDSVVKERT